MVVSQTGLPPTTRLVAFNPFVVQYWEVVGLPDADTGFAIELRSAPGREQAWKDLRQNGPLQVKLYGRENTWISGDQFYEVHGAIILTGRRSFRFDVKEVFSLNPEQVDQVRQRCENLRPRRDCASVF